jgi:hypothetical protein
MNQFLQQFTNNFTALGATGIILLLGFLSLAYLSKRRTMLHRERMASLIKALHYAGVAQDVFGQTKTDVRGHLLSGLRWILGALGLAGALCGYTATQPASLLDMGRVALIGAVPASIGLAHFIFYGLSRRQKPAPVARFGYRSGLYRPSNAR